MACGAGKIKEEMNMRIVACTFCAEELRAGDKAPAGLWATALPKARGRKRVSPKLERTLRGQACRKIIAEDGAPHKDKCGVCGKKRWCGVYDIDARARGKDDED